jgi:hypothetical protein
MRNYCNSARPTDIFRILIEITGSEDFLFLLYLFHKLIFRIKLYCGRAGFICWFGEEFKSLSRRLIDYMCFVDQAYCFKKSLNLLDLLLSVLIKNSEFSDVHRLSLIFEAEI